MSMAWIIHGFLIVLPWKRCWSKGKAAEKGSQGDQRVGVGFCGCKATERFYTFGDLFARVVQGRAEGHRGTGHISNPGGTQVRLEPQHTSITCGRLCPRMLWEPKDRVNLKRGKAKWFSGIQSGHGAGGACEKSQMWNSPKLCLFPLPVPGQGCHTVSCLTCLDPRGASAVPEQDESPMIFVVLQYSSACTKKEF